MKYIIALAAALAVRESSAASDDVRSIANGVIGTLICSAYLEELG